LIQRKSVSCSDYMIFVGYEFAGILVAIMVAVLWVVICLKILPITSDLVILYKYRAIAIPVFLSVDGVIILMLLIQLYRKWWQLKEQVTLVGDVEIINQPSRKRLEIKRKTTLITSQSYFSISDIIPTHLAILLKIKNSLNEPGHVAVPFTKWKTGTKAQYLIKLTLVGDPQTGKTSFCDALLGNPFSRHYQKTFGIDFCALCWEYPVEDKRVRFHITLWDTDGNYEKNSTSLKISSHNLSAFVLVYRVDIPQSLQSLEGYYQQIMGIAQTKQIIPNIVVLANMIDKQKEWKKDRDEEWIKRHLNENLVLIPVSCKTRVGLDRAAEMMVLSSCGLYM